MISSLLWEGCVTSGRVVTLPGHGWLDIVAMDAPPDDAADDDAGLARRVAARPAPRPRQAELVRRFAPRVRLFGLRHLRDESNGPTSSAGHAHDHRATPGRAAQPERIGSFVLGTVAWSCAIGGAHASARRGSWRPSPATWSPTRHPPRRSRARSGLQGCRSANGGARPHLLRRLRRSEVASELGIGRQRAVIRHRGLEHLRQCVTGSPTL